MSNYNKDAAIRGALRRTFSRSPVVREVLMRVRREVPKYNKDGSRSKKNSVQYLCASCNEWAGSTLMAVDHIDPVIPTTGFTDWNTFIDRLFCGEENLAPRCKTCHEKKTNSERTERNRLKDLEALSDIRSTYALGVVTCKETIKKVKKYLKKTKHLDVINKARETLNELST